MNPVGERIPNVATTLIDTLIASNRGDRDAFAFNAKRYSYQDVAALMNRAGSMVRAMGVASGSRVLLLLPASPALVGSLLGVMKAGAVPLVGAPLDPDGFAQFLVASSPAAVIVHENRLSAAESVLAAIPRDAVVVVGADVHGYKSFMHEMRGQPSWLAAEDVRGDAPALAFWTGSGVSALSHADIAAFVRGDGSLGGAAAGELTALGAMLRAFANGEEATLA